MANKRVSELTPISANEIATNDLFLLADVSAIESKKLPIDTLSAYLQTIITGSATASLANNAKTASYLLYQGFSNGTASYALTSSFNLSSSHANWADTASYALFAKSASYSATSSYAITASYALTSSVQLIYSSAFADYAKSASYLIYSGIPNGTASYAITALLAISARTASYLLYTSGSSNGTASYALYAGQAGTASYVLYSGKPNGTASYALRSNQAIIADGAVTSSFLYFSGVGSTGTASYALTASNANIASQAILATTASYATRAGSSANVYGTFFNSTALTITGVLPTTASFNMYVTGSGYRNAILDFSGDVKIPLSSSNPDNRYFYILVQTIDGGSPVSYQQRKPLSVQTALDITGSIQMPFAFKYYLSNINERAYSVTLQLYGSASLIGAGQFAGYGEGLRCYVMSDADNIVII